MMVSRRLDFSYPFLRRYCRPVRRRPPGSFSSFPKSAVSLSFNPASVIRFPTGHGAGDRIEAIPGAAPYAYIIIRNELYSTLEYSTHRGAEMATDPAELPHSETGESLEQLLVCGDLLGRPERAETSASGVTAKGFQAIRLLAQVYNSREIGKRFGVQANHATAWVAKARKQLAATSV